MDWLLVLAWAALLIGVAAAAFIYARSPSFWITFGVALFQKLWPMFWAQVLKDMADPEVDRRNKEAAHKANPQPMPSKFPKRDR